jgi:hypothetical protein
MEKQKIFTSGYVRKLKDEVSNGTSLKYYDESEFIIDEERLLEMPNIYNPDNLNGKLRIHDDYASAIAIYEAYENLTPLQASDERLWTYLSHVDLFGYLQERWANEKTSNYVLDHWFIKSTSQNNLLADNLSGMWWAVYLSIDNKRDDIYELTKELLVNRRDFAFRTLGTYKLGRYKEAVKGILEFIQENEKLFSTKFEAKSREVTKFLNIYGGTKPIPYFEKSEIKRLLQSHVDKIKG